MNMALATCKAPIDYINPHATSTPIGDIKEIEAIREVFGAKCPPISATKSLTGHSLGATGVQEAIYSLLMMQSGFICESANIENIDPAFEDMPIVRERKRQCRARRRAVELLRLWRHQCLGRLQAAGCMSVRVQSGVLCAGPSSDCRQRAKCWGSAHRAIRPGGTHEQAVLAVRPSIHSAQAVCHEQ